MTTSEKTVHHEKPLLEDGAAEKPGPAAGRVDEGNLG